MLAIKCLTSNLFRDCLKPVHKIQSASIANRSYIGNREWVGFGLNGTANYCDSLSFPCPAIRFKENTNELLALREKEKGDWKKLSLEEKKILYRASFRQTIAEVEAPTGQWKSVIGLSLISLSAGIWIYIFFQLFFYKPKPKTTEDQWRAASLRKRIDLKRGPIKGLSSRWDYEADNWKK